MQNNFIQLTNLTLKVAKNVLLDQINLAIDRGSYVAIIGENGIGKSSLLRLLARILKPTHGTLQVCARDEIGYAPDQPPLYSYSTVTSYLQFIREIKGCTTTQLEESIEALDLKTVRHRQINTLSKGLQQRLNLAQAIMSQPKLLLLDEPTNGIDQEHVIQICEYLKTLQAKGTTIILASHLYSEFVEKCDYMLKISNKTLSKVFPPLTSKQAEITHDHQHHPA